MPLLLTGKKFHNDLKTNKGLAIFAPLEGGYETRLLRRMRAKGFKTFITSARGLGDPEVFVLKLHGVRPTSPWSSKRRKEWSTRGSSTSNPTSF